jgi:hypothetical protein
MSDRRHYLATVLGMNPLEARYALDGRVVSAPLATLALLKLDGEAGFDEVLAFCTPEVRRGTLELLAGASTVPVRAIDVTADASPEFFLEQLDAALRGNGGRLKLTLDLTHGPRHLPLLLLLGSLYASALGRVEVRALYYGLYRDPPEESPLLDLGRLLDLAGFAYAARALRERGDPGPLASELERHADALPQRGARILRDIRGLAFASSSALPLELGRYADVFLRDSLGQVRIALARAGLPLVDDLLTHLSAPLEELRITTGSGQGWKSRHALSEDELRRQVKLVDALLERDAIGPALLLMEEWLISWGCFRLGETTEWLKRSVRERASTKLRALRLLAQDPQTEHLLGSEQKVLATLWRDLSDMRNSFAHAGMRGDELAPSSYMLERLRKEWERVREVPDWSLDPSGSFVKTLLVSPLGKTPGPLYSALRACPREPERVLVVASPDTRNRAREALERAGSPATLEIAVIEDPHSGVDEIEKLVRNATVELACAETVYVNVTGGTTLMGLAVESLASKAAMLGRVVRRFGLVDRRPRVEQEGDPYRAAEPYWLDEDGKDAE